MDQAAVRAVPDQRVAREEAETVDANGDRWRGKGVAAAVRALPGRRVPSISRRIGSVSSTPPSCAELPSARRRSSIMGKCTGSQKRRRRGFSLVPTRSRPIRGAEEPVSSDRRFQGPHEYGGQTVTEATLNGFPTSQIADDPGASLRFLVCATSFRPVMTSPCCTPCMSARRCLASKRCKPCPGLAERTTQKHGVFVLDFMNDTDTIRQPLRLLPHDGSQRGKRRIARGPPRNHRHGQLPGREVRRHANHPR
jgi:hypothetical protein